MVEFNEEALMKYNFSWSTDEEDLLLKIAKGEKNFGYMLIEKFTFPEFKKRYITPALLIMDVLALCLENAANLEKIKQEQEKFRLLLEYTVNWESFYHPQKGFLYISPSFEKITGYSCLEAYKDPNILEKLIFPEDFPLFEQYFSSKKKSVELRIRGKKGNIVWINFTATKIFSDTKEFLGIRASCADITDKKKKEFELDKLKGMIPICASCKRIRTDDGYWNQIESYIASISDIEFTHSLCPDCLKKYFPEKEKKKK